MNRNFYGLINFHGANVKYEFDDGTEDYEGVVMVFGSKKERDTWLYSGHNSIAPELYQSINKADARRLIEREVIACTENTREDVRGMSMHDLAVWYVGTNNE